MIEISKVEELKILEKVNTQYFKSRFEFLKIHNGIRPGELHLLMAGTGVGKSTLTKAIIQDSTQSGRVLLYLTEETVEDFKYQAIISKLPQSTLKRLTVFSEQDCKSTVGMGKAMTLKLIRDLIEKHKPDLFVMDNLTTCSGYGEIKEQEDFAAQLKFTMSDTGCAGFVVAHTGSHVSKYNQKLLTTEDLRGNKHVANLMPYFYCYQMFETSDGRKYPFINIQKCRKPQITNHIFALDYNKDLNIHTGDFQLPFEDLKAVYDDRMKL